MKLIVILLLGAGIHTASADIVKPVMFQVKPVTVVHVSNPGFPEIARKAGAEGEVIVAVHVDSYGRPLAARILKSTNPMFEQPAMSAAMQAEYSPASLHSGPVEGWIRIPFTFKKK